MYFDNRILFWLKVFGLWYIAIALINLVSKRLAYKYCKKHNWCRAVLENITSKFKGHEIGQDVAYILNMLRDLSRLEIDYYLDMCNSNRRIIWLIKEISLVINCIIYLIWQSERNFQILVLINIIGFICYSFESIIKPHRDMFFQNAGYLAFLEWSIIIAALCSENSIDNAICLSVEKSPLQLKLGIRQLSDNIRRKDKKIAAYMGLIQEFHSPQSISFINNLYENGHKLRHDALAKVIPGVKDLLDEMNEKIIKKIDEKKKAHISSLTKIYELAISMGLMINVISILNLSFGLSQLVA